MLVTPARVLLLFMYFGRICRTCPCILYIPSEVRVLHFNHIVIEGCVSVEAVHNVDRDVPGRKKKNEVYALGDMTGASGRNVMYYEHSAP